jgi:hypothetical protein
MRMKIKMKARISKRIYQIILTRGAVSSIILKKYKNLNHISTDATDSSLRIISGVSCMKVIITIARFKVFDTRFSHIQKDFKLSHFKVIIFRMSTL